MVDFKELIKKNRFYFVVIILIAILCLLVLAFKPHASAPEVLNPLKGTLFNYIIAIIVYGFDPNLLFLLILEPTSNNFYNLVTFGLGLDSTIMIWTIGIYLLYRWMKGGRSNNSQLIWGVSFLIYSITFIAHIFKGLGFSWANENASPGIFFFWRFGMIIWAAGSLYGILRILTEDKKSQIIPTIAVIISGLTWFAIGLLGIRDIELTMYGFLFTIWIPICFSIGYIFLNYGQKSGYSGPKIIFLGYLGLTITYMGWAPWHFPNVLYFYFVMYFLFLVSLVPILIGFILLSKESG